LPAIHQFKFYMRRFLLFSAFVTALFSIPVQSSAQNNANDESLGLPGDNLNLYAALKLFQESPTLEEFEKKLNDPENKVNNLDLNGDNDIDYIMVSDNVEKNVHSITLQVAVNDKEIQNVAVFIVDPGDGNGVQIQVVGDEDLYGKDYIIEPNYDDKTDKPDATPNPGYQGNSSQYAKDIVAAGNPVEKKIITAVEVSSWPVVQYIFVPTYVVWHSPWRWGYYPNYWRPWHPYFYHYYYGYHYHWHYYYHGYYRRWHHYRNPWWHSHYYNSGWRYRSNVYYGRYTRGDYRNTYSRPDMARDGSAYYRKKYPNTPGASVKVPSVKIPDRRPPIAKPRPVNPGNKLPGTNPPVAKPGNKLPGTNRPVTRPVTKPPVTNPGNKLPGTGQPVTKPVKRPPVTRPVTKPTVTKPATKPVSKPAPSRPAPKPKKPATTTKKATTRNL
jgi:hypothetical protein